MVEHSARNSNVYFRFIDLNIRMIMMILEDKVMKVKRVPQGHKLTFSFIALIYLTEARTEIVCST